jgi:hypothetical protein
MKRESKSMANLGDTAQDSVESRLGGDCPYLYQMVVQNHHHHCYRHLLPHHPLTTPSSPHLRRRNPPHTPLSPHHNHFHHHHACNIPLYRRCNIPLYRISRFLTVPPSRVDHVVNGLRSGTYLGGAGTGGYAPAKRLRTCFMLAPRCS